jgi:hypothetical protein
MKKAKKYLAIILVLAGIGMCASSADAAVVAVSTGATAFDIKVSEIGKVNGTNQTRFSFQPITVANPQNIDHWKIRVYCENGINVSVNAFNTNGCGKATQLATTTDNKFSVTLSNPTTHTVGFSFKLKAYDKNGKWLHTERQAFRWK